MGLITGRDVSGAQNEEFAIRERRTIVSALYLKGITQQQIAQKTGVSQATVSNDLKAIRKEWQKQRIDNFSEQLNIQLEKIELIEQDAWRAWEESRGEHVKVTEVDADQSSTTRTTESSAGDPRYLTVMLQCCDKRTRLMGLDAPIKIESAGAHELSHPQAARDFIATRLAQLGSRGRAGGLEPGSGNPGFN